MGIGFVVPEPTAADEAVTPDHLPAVVDHAICAVVDELRARGATAEVRELADGHWLLPPAAGVEAALALADRMAHCDLVVDATPAWAPLVRRSGRPLDAVSIHHPGLAPWADVTAFGVGNGSGRYLLVDRALDRALPAGPQGVGEGPELVVVPGDAGTWERGALAGDATAVVAGTGRWSAFVAAEALACGTPVIAAAGSPAAEVVDHGVTGLVVDDLAAVLSDPATRAEVASAAAELDRWACRKAAHDRFSAERAALDLLTLAGRPAADTAAPERVPAAGRPGTARRLLLAA
ncbi:MAG: glycosyltransferase [Acidimicrobiales bacterium]